MLAVAPTKLQNPTPEIFFQTPKGQNTQTMLHNLVITALGKHTPQVAMQFNKAITDAQCNISESRMTTLGNEFAALMMISGTWNAIAKFENLVPKLEKQLNITINIRRTDAFQPATELMPYAIDVVCCNREGVVYELVKFFTDNDIHIQEIYTSSYQANHTGTSMFSLHLTIHIPTQHSLATLRGEFMEFCDRMNLDAIMEPVK